MVNPRDAGMCLFTVQSFCDSHRRIVEFSNSDDASRAKADLADKSLLGRPVFIREVCASRTTHGRVSIDMPGSGGECQVWRPAHPRQDRHGHGRSSQLSGPQLWQPTKQEPVHWKREAIRDPAVERMADGS